MCARRRPPRLGRGTVVTALTLINLNNKDLTWTQRVCERLSPAHKAQNCRFVDYNRETWHLTYRLQHKGRKIIKAFVFDSKFELPSLGETPRAARNRPGLVHSFTTRYHYYLITV